VNFRATLALLAPLCAAAQEPPPPRVTLRGTVVVAGTGDPLPFTIVALGPGFTEQFTDEHGAFAFSGLSRGRYRLVVRQIGYTPADTSITVHSDSDVSVRIALPHIAIELPPITVTGRATCTRPGAPDRRLTPALAAVFGQMLENAHRYQLLADAYPYVVRFERTFTWVDGEGKRTVTRVDTIEHKSEVRWRYRPGKVVATGTGQFRGESIVRLPGLEDFADSAFLRAHCFRLFGLDTLEGGAVIRLDFDPAARLRSADVAGEVYLDSASYQMRYAVVRLTRPERANPPLFPLVATSRYREIAPGIELHDHVRSVTTLPPRARSSPPAQRIEEQRLLTVHFIRPLGREP
jgi:hypothetical protein